MDIVQTEGKLSSLEGWRRRNRKKSDGDGK